MATMTAAEIVAVASERVRSAFPDLPYFIQRGKRYFNIVTHTYNATRHTAARTTLGTFLAERRAQRAVMSAELSPKNIASEDALVRALVASAATYVVSALGFEARIGDEYAGVMPDDDDGDGRPRRLPVSESEAASLYTSALNTLLDALLAPVEAR